MSVKASCIRVVERSARLLRGVISQVWQVDQIAARLTISALAAVQPSTPPFPNCGTVAVVDE